MRISSKYACLSLVLFPAFIWGQAALAFGHQHCEIQCADSADIIRNRRTFTVIPTGSDDTSNIQCAFDSAVACGRLSTVKLVEGTYHTAQIVVRDFVGSFRGAGMHKTVVQNLLKYEVNVTEDDFFNREPSDVLKWPTIFAFVDHIDDPNDPEDVYDPDNDDVLNVSVSDMTIRAMGDPNDPNPDMRPTDGWSIFGLPTLYELAHAIVVLGPKTTIDVKRVHVEGQEAPGTLYGYNLINGVYPQGAFGGNPELMQGALTVKYSKFKNLASGVPFGSADKYRAIISHNKFDNVYSGTEGADILHSLFAFSHNQVNGVVGVTMYGFGDTDFGAESSSIIIKNNRFRDDVDFTGYAFEPEVVEGGDAVTLTNTFADDVYCLLLDNDISAVEGPGVYPGKIYLGPDTRKCWVINSGRRRDIVDEGTHNVIIPGKAWGHWIRRIRHDHH
jgi:hypothetical protein